MFMHCVCSSFGQGPDIAEPSFRREEINPNPKSEIRIRNPQEYRPSSIVGPYYYEHMTMSSNSVPIIDISPLVRLDHQIVDNNESFDRRHHLLQDEQLRDVAQQISHAVETVGFFAVTHHGVDPGIVHDAWVESKNFFDLDPNVKSSVPMTNDYPYGYENYESLGIKRSASSTTAAAAAATTDSKETFSIGPQNSTKSGMPSRKFPPDAPETFSVALTNYFNVMEHLARILFRGFALALQLEDVNWFVREGVFDDGHQCALRILNYPSIKYCRVDDEKVHIRAGGHTDYGAMTILKSGGPGLQLNLSPKDGDNNSSWFDVPHLSDAFIINLGDLMQRWTNDRWMSTLHRVIAVPDVAGADGDNADDGVFESARRQSIAFFVNVNGRAIISPFDSCVDDEHPSRYDAIMASDYLIRRHAQSMGTPMK